MGIGKKIKEHRKAHGMTQAELANKLGLTQSAIGKYESEDRTVSTSLLWELQDVFKDDFLIEALGLDRVFYEANLQEKIIMKFCDLYEQGIYLDDGEEICIITNDGMEYYVEQSEIDDLYDRFFQHMQIEFNALLKRVKNVRPMRSTNPLINDEEEG